MFHELVAMVPLLSVIYIAYWILFSQLFQNIKQGRPQKQAADVVAFLAFQIKTNKEMKSLLLLSLFYPNWSSESTEYPSELFLPPAPGLGGGEVITRSKEN